MFEAEYVFNIMWVIVVYGNFSAISRREQVNFQWDQDKITTVVVFFYNIYI